MTFGSNNSESSGCFYFIREFDVGTTSGHVGGNGYNPWVSSFCNNIGFLLVQFCVEDIVFHFTNIEHLTQQFRYFNRGGTNQHRASLLRKFGYLVDYGIVFFSFGFVNEIIFIPTRNGSVGWNFYYVKFVDFPEFPCFGNCRTCHARKLVVHAEIVLQGNGRKSLRSRFNLYILFGFNGLVQSVGVTTSIHDTSCLLIDDHDLVVHHHIFGVFFK